jgi:hypothetical protein
LARAAAAALALLALAVVTGCGGGNGVAAGATVNVYVNAQLCPGAREALSSVEGRAGDVDVRALCLRPALRAGKIDLVAQGQNARRATEDSTTVAFIEAKGKPSQFTRPIVEAAEIAYVPATSGTTAMHQVLQAISNSGGGGSLRDQVREALE